MRFFSIITIIAIVLALGIGGLLAYASTRPDTYSTQRRIVIHSSPERLHGLINDLRQLNTWSPYNRKDPSIALTYQGPTVGPGAAFDFKGNSKVGSGRIEITATAPTKVTMSLHMIEPFEGRNVIEFILEPQGADTTVIWAMQGPSPLLSKVVGIFLDMDQMIGRDFEAGLANLKALAESAPTPG